MSWRPKGKHVDFIDVWNPEALGICDFTQFIFKRKDLVRQMEYRGDRLLWTGFYVGRPYVDRPNPQLKPPILKPDPVPVIDPRPPQGTANTWASITSPYWQNIDWTVWSAWDSYTDGVPAAPESVRLANLTAGGSILQSPAAGAGYPPPPPIIPEAIRLANLQSFRWGV